MTAIAEPLTQIAAPSREAVAHAAKVALKVALYITVLALVVPLDPGMPGSGLDASWAYAMNEAIARHLVIGRDLVFTYGPYSFLFSHQYHPATDHLALIAGIVAATACASVLWQLVEDTPSGLVAALLLVLAAAMPFGADLLVSYPLLVALATRPLLAAGAPPLDWRKASRLCALYASMGLLCLVRQSVFLLSILTLGQVVLLAIYARKARVALCAATGMLASMVLFWLLSGQPLTGLLGYIRDVVPIVSGYTEAMSLPGNALEVVLFVLSTLAALAVIGAESSLRLADRAFLMACFGIYLLSAFKQGFVRHDAHALGAAFAIVLSSLLLVSTISRRLAIPVLLASIVTWSCIDMNYSPLSTRTFYANLSRTFRSPLRGLDSRLNGSLQARYAASIAQIRQDSAIARLEGSADVYSYGQAALIASGNRWSPRPVFQSYTAYTPELARWNAAHLSSPDAPQYVLFRIEPIDGHFPSIEDGASWPALIRNYERVRVDHGFVHLQKRSGVAGDPARDLILEQTRALGETITLPEVQGLLFAEIDLESSFLGRLGAAFYKPGLLEISVELSDGRRGAFRYIASMGRSPFLISPLVTSADSFAGLYDGEQRWASGRVKSIRIAALEGSSWSWQPRLRLRLTELKIEGSRPAPPAANASARPDQSVECAGAIESIGGTRLASGAVRVQGALHVAGWLAISVPTGTVPDRSFLTLTDPNGRIRLFQMARKPRPDVAKHLHQDSLIPSGFSADIGMADFPEGEYSMGLARTYRGRTEVCPQVRLALVVSK